MQIVYDLYCTNIKNLFSKKLIDEKSTLQMKNYN
jgi:hypothetical protein